MDHFCVDMIEASLTQTSKINQFDQLDSFNSYNQYEWNKKYSKLIQANNIITFFKIN